VIAFQTNDASGNGVTRMTIAADGNVGIGGAPGTRSAADYIDQAKAKIKSWTAAIKTKLDEEPKADKKAVTLEVTDDAFEVVPTEDLVAEWMAERAIGGGDAKLQVAGDIYSSNYIFGRTIGTGSAPFIDGYFSNSVSVGAGNDETIISDGAIYRNSTTSKSGISLGTGNIYACDYQGVATDGVTNLGGDDYKWKDAHFSGTIYGDVDGASLRAETIVQDGAPVVDSLQIIRAFMKLRDAVDDPDSSVEELRDKLKVAVVDIIDQFQDLVDSVEPARER
jgi:hypothetical protein